MKYILYGFSVVFVLSLVAWYFVYRYLTKFDINAER